MDEIQKQATHVVLFISGFFGRGFDSPRLHQEVLQALFDALSEFKPNPDDLEVISTGKITDQGVRLRLPGQGITIFFGLAACKFTKEGAIWAEADQIISILQKFLQVLTDHGGIILGKKVAVLTLHLQPKTISFKAILLPFVDERLRKIDPAPLDAMAIVTRWPGRRITLDGSAQLANGIFAQMEREFAAEINLDQIRQNVFEDETNLFSVLDVLEVEP
jgi:hypothetical protein